MSVTYLMRNWHQCEPEVWKEEKMDVQQKRSAKNVLREEENVELGCSHSCQHYYVSSDLEACSFSLL